MRPRAQREGLEAKPLPSRSFRWRLYGAVFLISTSTLCLELVHMRVLSVAMWQSLVYSVVTVALLGFGVSGAFLSVWRGAFRIRQEVLLTLGALALAVSNLVVIRLGATLSVDAFELARNPRVIAPLFVYFALLALPYFFGGAVIGLALARNTALTSRLYCANMIGAGAGCMTFLCLIGLVGAPVLLFAMSGLAAVAAGLFAISSWRPGVALSCTALCLIAALSPAANHLLVFKVCQSKILGRRIAEEPETVVELTHWTPTGRVDVLSGPTLVFENWRTGLTFPYKEVLTDGDAYTRLFHHPAKDRQLFVPYDNFGLNVVYKLNKSPKVLVIGLGAGKEIWEALGLGAREVVAVEFNPVTIELVREQYADFIGNPTLDPRVKIVFAEGRNYVRRHPSDQFDILFMNGVDTFAALASGAYTMAENYLYTVEAMQDYLRTLTDDGMISISRCAFRVPRETLRLAVTALQALRENGVPEPWRHLIVLDDYGWGTVLVKKSPFTAAEVSAVERLADEGWARVVYRPGLEDATPSPFNLSRYGKGIWEPAPYGDSVNPAAAFVNAFKHRTTGRFYESYLYDIRPVRDENPFFFKYYKWSNLLSRSAGRVVWDAPGGSLALAVLGALLLGSGIAVVVLIFLPLFVSTKARGELAVTSRSICYAIYFCALGIGFMFVEISLMQRFTLFLGHPSYSIATVLSSMLIFSGIGSLLAGLAPLSHRTAIVTSILAVCALLVVYTLGLSPLLSRLLSANLLARNIIGGAVIAPLAFFMGIPFPTGLKAVGEEAPSFVPWAWGVNGASSVLASVASIIIAMHAGFPTVLYSAAIIYLVGCCAILLPLRRRG